MEKWLETGAIASDEKICSDPLSHRAVFERVPDEIDILTKNMDFSTECPVETAITIVGGKWKLFIIALLRLHTCRFGELKKKLPHISERMLARQLRELERDNIISRKVYPEIPPRVEYALIKDGETLIPILDMLGEWGKRYQASRSDVKATTFSHSDG